MSSQKVTIWIVLFLAVVLSVYLENFVVQSDGGEIALFGGLAVLLFWTCLAGRYWWSLVPAAVGFGGLFYYGFKIYFHEIALVLCLLPLGPLYLLRRGTIYQSRPALSWPIHLMTLFLLLHCAYSFWYTPSGWGNILRAEMNALWPLIFFYPFYFFGSSRVLFVTVVVLYLAFMSRWAIEIYSYFDPGFTYLPGLNFVPSQDSVALRYSSLFLLAISWSCYLCVRSPVWKMVHVLVSVTAVAACLLGGGRSNLIVLLGLPVFWAGLYRKWWLVLMSGIFAAVLIIGINYQPQVLEGLPLPVERSLSVLVLQPGTLQIQRETEDSNRWHYELREHALNGLWKSPSHALFGYPIEPFVDLVQARFVNEWEKFEYMVDAAARSGGYESGVGAILGIYGILGAVLYFLIFYHCVKGLPDHLRNCSRPGMPEVFYLLAYSHLFIWFALSWVAGGIPSLPLMFALIGKTIRIDQMKKEAEEKEVTVV